MKQFKIDVEQNKKAILNIFNEILNLENNDYKKVEKVLRKNPGTKGILSKGDVIYAYNNLKSELKFSTEKETKLLTRIKMKSIRTISGVTPVTVLTKPFPCPGKCIFCPNDVRMPKSYLSDEPGAQRAEANRFDPYLQTHNRLAALKNIGHPIDKVELIILGGTWSSYPESYQIWFVKRCFDAMNDFYNTNMDLIKPKIKQPYKSEKMEEIEGDKIIKSYNQIISLALDRQKETQEKADWKDLFATHKENETAKIRCIGLVIETRPDEINKDEVIRIRKLGATKVQIGIQLLNNRVLRMNKRGHDVEQTKNAIALLRQAGFKIHAHWMPNLYGSNSDLDIKDYKKLFTKNFKPDEVKVYPCSLIESAELMYYYKKGLWKPYSESELIKVLTEVLKLTPEYCRITRMIRDIPSTDIVTGNQKTNFRQIVETEAIDKGYNMKDIRHREIKESKVKAQNLKMQIKSYKTSVSTEKFIQFVTLNNKLAAFLRLSLPTYRHSERMGLSSITEGSTYTKLNSRDPSAMPQDDVKGKIHFISELKESAIIREIHVYGQAVDIGKKQHGKAQHIGLGKQLIKKATKIAKKHGYKKLAVISSVGTREYYRKRGFKDGELYQYMNL